MEAHRAETRSGSVYDSRPQSGTPNAQKTYDALANKSGLSKVNWKATMPITTIAKHLRVAKHVVVFTGAGGFCLGQSSLRPVGIAPPPHSCPVHFAKFVGDTMQNWHGYPVAHWVALFDKPPQVVLKVWADDGILTKPQFARIVRGKKCAL